MLAECQVIMLMLDFINVRSGTNVDMFVFWQIIYMSSLFTCVVILPFMYFFYETEEDQDYKTRFCQAFKNEILVMIVFCIIHFPMFSTMRHCTIPVEAFSYNGLQGAKKAEIDKVFLTLSDPEIYMKNYDYKTI